MIGELPSNWVIAALKEIAFINMGQSPPSSTYNTVGEGLPFFQGKAEFTEDYPVPVKWCTDPKKTAQKEDILISVRAPVGPTNLAPSLCCIGRGLAAIAPEQGVNRDYLLYALRHTEEELASRGTGSTFSAISGGVLGSHPIPLAPEREQMRIASKLTQLTAHNRKAREALEEIPELLETLRAAVLYKAFSGELTASWRKKNSKTEPASKLLKRIKVERRKLWKEEELRKLQEKAQAKGQPIPEALTEKHKAKYKEPEPVDPTNLHELPEGWCWASFEELTMSSQNGLAKRKGSIGSLVNVLRLSDIQNLQIDESDPRAIKLDDTELHKYKLELGDLLCIRVNGSEDLVGRMILYDSQNVWAYCDHFIRWRTIPDMLNFQYLVSLFNSDRVRTYIQEHKVSSAGQNTVNQTVLGNLPLPLCSEMEQLHLANILASIEQIENLVRDELSVARVRLNELQQKILLKAFRGELVQQNPNDEPASVLLERITALSEILRKNPRKKWLARNTTMKQTASDLVVEAISKMASDSFTFDDLRAAVSLDYESMKDVVFELLDSPQPLIAQKFSDTTNQMTFVRVDQ